MGVATIDHAVPTRVACAVCGGIDQVGVPVRTAGSTWAICNGCGLVFQSPRRPTGAVEARYASGAYHAERGGVPEHYVEYSLRRSVAAIDWALARIDDGRGRRALDVGCGVGGALVHLAGAGYSTCGVEPDPHLSAVARERFGLEVRTGFFDGATFPSGTAFDFVYSCHVWEHLVDPVATARAAHTLLRPTLGHCMIVVPTHERARTTSWRYMNADHTHLYTEVSLGNVLRAAGFEIVDVTHRSAGDAELWMLARATATSGGYGHRVEPVASVRRALLTAPLRLPLGVPARAAHHLQTLRRDPREFVARAHRTVARRFGALR